MNKTVTIKVDEQILNKMKDFYSDYLEDNKGEYIVFFAKMDNVNITAYTTGKVLFIGDNALYEASIWDENAKLNEIKSSIKASWICLKDQIGSDEVGVGDFFLPMIVVASFVREKDIPLLKKYGVTDSKKLTDKDIIEIAEALKEKFFISKLTLPNEKYNEMISKGENLNSLKAKMHNRALLNLLKKFPDCKHVFVDQFCNENTYYKYLNDVNEPQVRNIVFKTKGESYFPSVALSSVIARYYFLKEKEELEKKYNVSIPFGASSKVDTFSKEFIKNFGKEEFDKLVKKNFANYDKAQ